MARPPGHWRRIGLLLCGAFVAAAAVLGSALAGVGWWLDCGDAPQRADIIVVLGGGYARPIYGADLYLQGLAPEVWQARIRSEEGEARARGLGVALPRETEVNHAVLLKKGVPEKAIRLYGQDVNSTSAEAEALAREFDGRGKTILLVTSRYHARRARLIFQRRLPGARVIVCPTTYETFDRRWWRHKTLASNAVMEMLKLGNYLAGSPFGQEP